MHLMWIMSNTGDASDETDEVTENKARMTNRIFGSSISLSREKVLK